MSHPPLTSEPFDLSRAITLTQAAALIPSTRRTGRSINRQVLWRWATSGRFPAKKIDNNDWMTMPAWVAAFAAARERGDRSPAPTYRTSRSTRASQRRAEAILMRLGLPVG